MTDKSKQNEPLSVLIVDDDADFRASLQGLLEIGDYRVETAGDAESAMAALHTFEPDVALVDLRLGADDGIELLKEMLRLTPELICVTVTAYSDTDSAVAAMKGGAYDYLRKPFEAEELYAVLRRCSDKCRMLREKQEVDQALRESEGRFRVAFETSPDAIILARSDGRIIDVNPGFERLTGYSLEDVVGKTSLEIHLWQNPDDRTVLLEQVEQYGYANNIVAKFRLSNGSVRVGLISARTFMLSGELSALYVVRDVHDIMAREKALAESEQRYRQLSDEYSAVLEGIPDALMLIGADLKVVWANKGATRHFGFTTEAMRGKECDVVWKCNAEHCLNCLKEVFRTGEALDVIQKMPDGRTWGLKQFPVKDHAGEVSNVIQIASDLTEKTRLREQASRSAHLAAIGELAAGVAHEVNNPIGMMLLDLPMLRDVFNDLMPILDGLPDMDKDQEIAGLTVEKLSKEVPPVIDEVIEGARKVKRIVEELRDFSRPYRGVMELIDINEVAKKAVRMVRNPLKNATETFSETYFPETLPCIGDPQRLEQVVINLLLNACQALTSRSAKIAIETRKDDSGGSIQLIVRDEGCGVEPEDIKLITDPFYTTRRESGGTGLGLSVSSRIVSEHKGLLGFQSQPGEGTTVVLELPLVEQDS